MILNNQTEKVLNEIETIFNKIVTEFGDLDIQSGNDKEAKALISEAMLYSLNAGGKRIRPMILLEMAKAYGDINEGTVAFAAAIEMIHTYSLIHDDLPCMDDDDIRRGKPTSHVVYGEDIAVLTGDSLLNLAAEVMMDTVIKNFGNINYMVAMREILKASGSNGMILGQVADIKYHETVIDVAMLDFINSNKTGRLLTAAIVAGAYIGGAKDAEIKKLREIGYDIGLLFQIVDDVLDVIGDAEKLGKRTQIDTKNNKKTYPNLMGLEGAQEVIQKLQQRINANIALLTIESSFLKSLVHFLVHRDY